MSTACPVAGRCRSLAFLASHGILSLSQSGDSEVWPILDGQVADLREPEYPRSWQLGGLIWDAYGGAELMAYFGVSAYTWLASARS